MTWKSDDLAQVIVGEDREFVGYAQGILREWDPETHRNVVEVRGGTLTDLPVADPIGALTYTPGQVLKLIRWKQRTAGGIASYWIDGSVSFPAEGRAEQSIAFMRGQLARQIVNDLVAELLVSPAGQELAAFVFGQRVHSDAIPGQESTTSLTYTDLATAGPTVPDVSISDAGLAIVFANAGIRGGGTSTQSSQGGDMSFAVTGDTTIAATANDPRSVRLGVALGDFGDIGTPNVIDRSCSMAVVPLNPGMHTFTAKYRATGSGTPTGLFNQRSLVVIAL